MNCPDCGHELFCGEVGGIHYKALGHGFVECISNLRADLAAEKAAHEQAEQNLKLKEIARETLEHRALKAEQQLVTSQQMIDDRDAYITRQEQQLAEANKTNVSIFDDFKKCQRDLAAANAKMDRLRDYIQTRQAMVEERIAAETLAQREDRAEIERHALAELTGLAAELAGGGKP